MGSLVEQANTRAVSNDNAALGPHLFFILLSKAIAGGAMSCMNEAHSTEFMVNRVLFAAIYAVIFSELAGTVYFTISAPIDARAMSFSSVLFGMLNIGAFTLIPATCSTAFRARLQVGCFRTWCPLKRRLSSSARRQSRVGYSDPYPRSCITYSRRHRYRPA
jgi:hypothetical protein